MKSVKFISFLLCIFSVHVFANEPLVAEDQQNNIQYEQRIYVPYEQLNEVLTDEEQTVFIPYSDFLKLWQEAYEKNKEPKNKPPIDGAISSATIEGVEKDGFIEFKGTFQFNALIKNNWSKIPLQYNNLGIKSAKIGNTDAAIAIDNHRQTFLLYDKPGLHTLEMNFISTISTNPGKKSLKFKLPASPQTKLSLQLQGRKLEVKSLAKNNVVITEKDQATTVESFVGSDGVFHIEWLAKTSQTVSQKALVFSKANHDIQIDEGILKGNHQFNLQISQSKVKQFNFKLPASISLLNVTSKNLKQWQRDEEGKLTLEFFEEFQGKHTITLETEKLLKSKAQSVTIPNISVLETVRDEGSINIFNSPELKLKTIKKNKLTQHENSIVSKNNQKYFASFKYLSQPYSLELNKEPIEPKIKTTWHSDLYIDENILDLNTTLNLEVENAGIYDLTIQVPRDYRLVEIKNERAIEDYQIIQTESGHSEIKIQLKLKAIGHLKIPFHFEQITQKGNTTFDIPHFNFQNAFKQKGNIHIWALQKYKVTSESLKGLRSTSYKQISKSSNLEHRKFEFVSGFKFSDTKYSGKLNVTPRKTRVSVNTNSFVSIEENVIKLEEHLNFNIEFAPIQSLEISIPSNYAKDLVINGANIKEKKLSIDTEIKQGIWQITLHENTIGSYSLNLKSEIKKEPIEVGASQTQEIPYSKAKNVFAQTGHVGIIKNKNIQVQNASNTEGIEQISPKELPNIYKKSGVALAFKYVMAPYNLQLVIQKFEYASILSTLIEVGHFDMALSLDGNLRTEAVFRIKNSNKQMLELIFPNKSTQIISTFVSGKKVSLSKGNSDNSKLLILPNIEQKNQAFTLRVTYQTPLHKDLSFKGALSLKPVIIKDVFVSEEVCRLWVPRRYHYYGFDGTWEKYTASTFFERMLGLNHRASIRYNQQLRYGSAMQLNAFPDEQNGLFSNHTDLVREGTMYQFKKLDGNGFVNIKFIKKSIYKNLHFFLFIVLIFSFFKIPRKEGRSNYKIATFFFIISFLSWPFFSAELSSFPTLLSWTSILLFPISFIENRIRAHQIKVQISNHQS